MGKPRKLSLPERLKENTIKDLNVHINKIALILDKIEFNEKGAEGMTSVFEQLKQRIRIKENEQSS